MPSDRRHVDLLGPTDSVKLTVLADFDRCRHRRCQRKFECLPTYTQCTSLNRRCWTVENVPSGIIRKCVICFAVDGKLHRYMGCRLSSPSKKPLMDRPLRGDAQRGNEKKRAKYPVKVDKHFRRIGWIRICRRGARNRERRRLAVIRIVLGT